MSKLFVELRQGETLTVGGARVRLEKKSGQIARLTIEADPSISITTPARRSALHSENGATPKWPTPYSTTRGSDS